MHTQMVWCIHTPPVHATPQHYALVVVCSLGKRMHAQMVCSVLPYSLHLHMHTIIQYYVLVCCILSR